MKNIGVIFILSFLFLQGISNNIIAQEKGNYTKLKNMVKSDVKSNRTDIYESLKGFSHDTLFEVAEQASGENNKVIMFECIGLELHRRAKKDDLGISYFLDQLSRKDLNPNYGYLLLWVMKSAFISYNTDDLNRFFDLTTQYISKSTSLSFEQKLQAIVTNNNILAYLKGKDQVSNTKLTAYCNELQSIMMDRNENSEIRRAAIKGIQYLNRKEAIGNLLTLIADNDVINDAPLARSLCIALSHFNEISAIPHIENIIINTEDEYIYASAAIALGDLGGEHSLKILVENENRFDGGYCGVAIRKMGNLVFNLLSNNNTEMLHYAVKATKYFYEGNQVNPKEPNNRNNFDVKQYKPLLKSLLYKTNDKTLIKLILERFSQIIDKEEAKEIVEKIPRDEVYAVEWDFINNFANSIEIKGGKSNIPVDESYMHKGNTFEQEHQEYGDPGYRENHLIGSGIIGWLGHTGLCAGIDSQNKIRIIEVGGLFSPVVKHNYWSSMQDDPTYWGANTLNQSSMTFDKRKNVMETAKYLIGRDIGYPVLPSIDAIDVQWYPFPGTIVDPDEITELRCDGLIEYCYEYNNNMVWGKDESNYDISIEENVKSHNDFYSSANSDPNTELAPIVQCGRAGGTSTHMIWAAIIDPPTYSTGYTQNGTSVTVTITANDKSGIHYIGYKIGSNGNWEYSPNQPQHPNSSSYTYQFTRQMAAGEYIYYFAMDNGGNYPEYGLYFQLPQLSISSGSITHNFGDVEQGNNPASRTYTFTVKNSGGGTLTGNVSESAGWLTRSPSSFSLSANQTETITITATTSSLSSGSYSENISVTSNGGNTSGTASVNITKSPLLAISSGSITYNFGEFEQGSNPDPNNYNFELKNIGGGTLTGNISENASWLTKSPTSFSLSANQTETITITATTSSLSSGSYSENISVTSNGGNTSGTATVTQAGSTSLTITPSNIDVDSNEGSTTFTINSNVNWTVSSDSSWLTLSPSSGDSGTTTLTANYETNSSKQQRVATITVTVNAVNIAATVTQAGENSGGAIGNIAIINPDHYRIIKFGVYEHGTNQFRSIANGEVADGCSGGISNPDCWSGVGTQLDFLGTVLTNAGYDVTYFTSETMPNILKSDYDIVIVQDPLLANDNLKLFDKSVEDNLPNLLEYTTSQNFNEKLIQYFNSGGNIILVGDAVRLLDNSSATYTLGFGKTVQTGVVNNIQSQPDALNPTKWLFLHGAPFCGIDRNGRGTYKIVDNSLSISIGTKIADLTLFDGNDIPQSEVWSDVIYYPSDGISLASVKMKGSADYVLDGSICNPPIYTDSVDAELNNFFGFTTHSGKRIYYISSDSFFDFHFKDNNGAWHAGSFQEIKFTVSSEGKQLLENFVKYILQYNQSTNTQVWTEGFETYSSSTWPSSWTADANATDLTENHVDNTVFKTGSNSLKLYGTIGSCWGALAYKSLTITEPFEIELAVRNGNELLSGCHPDRAYVGLRKGTSWSNPSRTFVSFKGDGTIESGGKTVSLGSYSTLTWYTVKVKYEKINSSDVKLSYWINGTYKGSETLSAIAEEDQLNNFEITVQEGTAWFDDVSVFKDSISTDVKTTKYVIPKIFLLKQNYPNPFNPTTTIKYNISKSAFVTLKVYSIMGRLVSTLVNEQKKAGSYCVTWNASELSSGVYFYKITANNFSDVKKIVLLK